jgi:hypothetical protein
LVSTGSLVAIRQGSRMSVDVAPIVRKSPSARTMVQATVTAAATTAGRRRIQTVTAIARSRSGMPM